MRTTMILMPVLENRACVLKKTAIEEALEYFGLIETGDRI